MPEDKKVDYLEVDDPIPGQNYVCLSFVSPEELIKSKEAFKVSKFLQSYCKDKDMELNRVMKDYDDFIYKYSDELQRDFDNQNNFQTNIRGLKVRGTYSTKEEAEKRAKTLQNIDSDFHVFVGQVGYWLPWDPCADKVQDEYYIDSQLNDMMEKYKENNIDRDIFYEEEKRDKVKAARDEVLRKKMEQKNKTIEDPVPEGTPDKVKEILSKDDIEETTDDVKDVVEETTDDVKDVVEETTDAENIVEGIENTIDGDVKASLESVDPWMVNKLKEEKDNI